MDGVSRISIHFLLVKLPYDAFVVPPVLSAPCLQLDTSQSCLEDLFPLVSEVVAVHEGGVVRESRGRVVGEWAG